jgi:hypothetical protein
MEYKGGMPAQPSVDIVTDLDENIGYAPRKLGIRPAYGLYCAYIDGLSLADVRVGFEQNDERPAMICHNINGLTVSGFQCERGEDRPAPAVFKDVTSVFLAGNPSLPEVDLHCEALDGPEAPLHPDTEFSVEAVASAPNEGFGRLVLRENGKTAKTAYAWFEAETPKSVNFYGLSLSEPGEYRLSVGGADAIITVLDASDVPE